MSESTNQVSGWPMGALLRFRLDADLQAKYRHLRGAPVLVLSAPRYSEPSDGYKHWSWRQCIFVFAGSFHRTGWAKPSDLEPRPDTPMLPAKQEEKKTSRPKPELA